MSMLTPDTQAPSRPSSAELALCARPPASRSADSMTNLQVRVLYLRSYLLMRALVGFIGLGLPLVLVVGDSLVLNGGQSVRHSMSAYYYSGMRDYFVGSLCAIAVFLVAYKVFERSLNNLLSMVAGASAVVVAFFPTSRPETKPALTALQERLGEGLVSTVHYTASGIFIVCLGVISVFFGLQEGRRSQLRARGRSMMSPVFWRWFHWVCAGAIFAAVVFIVVTSAADVFATYSLLIGEVVAVVAFGLSWLFKGLELDILVAPAGRTGPAGSASSYGDPSDRSDDA